MLYKILLPLLAYLYIWTRSLVCCITQSGRTTTARRQTYHPQTRLYALVLSQSNVTPLPDRCVFPIVNSSSSSSSPEAIKWKHFLARDLMPVQKQALPIKLKQQAGELARLNVFHMSKKLRERESSKQAYIIFKQVHTNCQSTLNYRARSAKPLSPSTVYHRKQPVNCICVSL